MVRGRLRLVRVAEVTGNARRGGPRREIPSLIAGKSLISRSEQFSNRLQPGSAARAAAEPRCSFALQNGGI